MSGRSESRSPPAAHLSLSGAAGGRRPLYDTLSRSSWRACIAAIKRPLLLSLRKHKGKEESQRQREQEREARGSAESIVRAACSAYRCRSDASHLLPIAPRRSGSCRTSLPRKSLGSGRSSQPRISRLWAAARRARLLPHPAPLETRRTVRRRLRQAAPWTCNQRLRLLPQRQGPSRVGTRQAPLAALRRLGSTVLGHFLIFRRGGETAGEAGEEEAAWALLWRGSSRVAAQRGRPAGSSSAAGIAAAAGIE